MNTDSTTLTDDQRCAVEVGKGPVVVVAGPGAGKTRVITKRVEHVIRQLGVQPQRVCAITFTNKAADEMRKRLLEQNDSVMQDPGSRPFIGTFHGLCASILRPRCKNFSICDVEDSKAIIKQVLSELSLARCEGDKDLFCNIVNEVSGDQCEEFIEQQLAHDISRPEPSRAQSASKVSLKVDKKKISELQKIFSKWKGKGFVPEPYSMGSEWKLRIIVPDLEDTHQLVQGHRGNRGKVASFKKEAEDVPKPIRCLFRLYNDYLKARNLVDFDDLLIRVAILGHQSILGGMFDYVLVDEFQDTNCLQSIILGYLSSAHNNVFVVGDYNQSIYGFRNAQPELMAAFGSTKQDARVFQLKESFRSTKNILHCADKIATFCGISLHGSKEKNLSTRREDGSRVVVASHGDKSSEAAAIAGVIQKCVMDQKSVAVLCRSMNLSRSIETALNHLKIEYTMRGGRKFFDRSEVKDVLAYLRLVTNAGDISAAMRIINRPARKIGDTSQKLLFDNCNSEDVLKHLELASDGLKGPAKTEAKKFVNMLNNFRASLRVPGPGLRTLTGNFLASIGYQAFMRSEHKDQWETRWSNVEELLEALDEHEKHHQNSESKLEPHALLSEFLQSASLTSGSDDSPGQGQKAASIIPVISTVHAAKGLEWNCVFVLGLIEGVFPMTRRDVDLQEEARIFYVAVTRAKDYLALCSSQERVFNGHAPLSEPARWLGDLPKLCVNLGTEPSAQEMTEAMFENKSFKDQRVQVKRLRDGNFNQTGNEYGGGSSSFNKRQLSRRSADTSFHPGPSSGRYLSVKQLHSASRMHHNRLEHADAFSSSQLSKFSIGSRNHDPWSRKTRPELGFGSFSSAKNVSGQVQIQPLSDVTEALANSSRKKAGHRTLAQMWSQTNLNGSPQSSAIPQNACNEASKTGSESIHGLSGGQVATELNSLTNLIKGPQSSGLHKIDNSPGASLRFSDDGVLQEQNHLSAKVKKTLGIRRRGEHNPFLSKRAP